MPSDPGLAARVLDRLNKVAASKDDSWKLLVLAALEGDEGLGRALASDTIATKAAPAGLATTARDKSKGKTKSAPSPSKGAATTAEAPVAYLRSITVEGFRGVGKPVALELPPGPGLTLVIGRNGSGKSSFAEGLELLLTGETYRWLNRAKIWKEGWRNLHHPHAVIQAEFSLQGEPKPCALALEWPDGDVLESGRRTAQIRGKERTDAGALGWDEPLKSYRPCLSYNELGSMLDEGPSKLYDGLAAILGLEELVNAQKRLADARLGREKDQKAAAEMQSRIVAALRATFEGDDRARRVVEALDRKEWDLDTVDKVLAGATSAPGQDETAIGTLQRLASLVAPSAPDIERLTERLRKADQTQKAVAGTIASRARQLAELLDRALAFHDAHGDGACPVCDRDGALGAAWHEKKRKEASAFREAAAAATSASGEVEAARKAPLALVVPPANVVERASSVGLDKPGAAALQAIGDWQLVVSAGAGADLAGLARNIETASAGLRKAIDALREAAIAELAGREDRWRPLAVQLAGWVQVARDAVRGAAAVPAIKSAEKWLKDTSGELRDERFVPIAHRAQEICDELLRGSNVKVAQIQLAGTASARRVDLDVTVDGVASAALGVMSQGELNALALSLFIPRATLEESPFRFIVIDDPVQSMDPARVDGLARVLQKAATARQVVVFTHDDRLPETVRRLGIPATIVEVTRRENSAVETRVALDPVSKYLADAFTVAKTAGLPAPAARRVIPGLCRFAVEAACMEAVRRRRLAKGENYGAVERLLADASHGLSKLMALTLFDDPERGGDVLGALKKQEPSFPDTFQTLNRGAHGLDGPVPTIDLARSAENLAHWLQKRA
jgi:recombinational DNA repair ATPase RecF